MSWRRQLSFWAVLIAVGLAAVELLLQAYYYATAGDFIFRRHLPPIYVADPVRCYGLLPNVDYVHHTNEFVTPIFTNSQGFRTGADRREVSVEKPDDHYRILVLGPSFAFGWGSDYEEIFPTLLEKRLPIRGKTVEVVNLGTPSQGPEHQLCWVQEFGHAYDPDLVILTVYGASIPSLPSGCPENLTCPVVDAGLLFTTQPTLGMRIVAFSKNSALVFYGYYLSQFVMSSPNDAEVGKEFHGNAEEDEGEGGLRTLADSYESYAQSVQRAVGEGSKVAFVYIPYSFVVHPEDEPRWRHIRNANPWPARRRIESETRELRDRGVPILNATLPLIERAKTERVYYWLDIHLTPAGNEAVADAIVAFLEATILGARPGPHVQAVRSGP